MQIDGSHFVVSGAASGLGAATARMLIDEGGRVGLIDTNVEAGAKLARELGSLAVFVEADVTDAAAVSAAVSRSVTEFGPLGGAACCAGIVRGERILGRAGAHGAESFRTMLDVNLTGSFNLLCAAAQAIAAGSADEDGERGVIVMTASIAAFEGQIGQAAYAASKAGIIGMTLPAARELAQHGIRVMTIAPGLFETPMTAGFTPELQDTLERSVPFPPRFARPTEFARLVRDICENRMLNGTVIRLDGALRLAPK